MKIYIIMLLATFVTASAATVRDLGIPVRAVNWERLHPGVTSDGKASLLATFGQHDGGFFVADINLDTGHCRQFMAKDRSSTYPTAAYRSLRTGVLYIGSTWDAHFHRFDPNHPERGVEDLGQLDPAGGDFPTRITETPDGMIFIGMANGARLVRFDPNSGVFTRFGRMDAIDEYIYPIAGDDGSLAGLVRFVRPHIVVIDPVSGEYREVGPAITDTTDKTQYLRLFKGIDRRLYIDSHLGKYIVEQMEIRPVAIVPDEMPDTQGSNLVPPLPGGWVAQFISDNVKSQRNLLLTNTDPFVPSRTLTLDWTGSGTALHVMDVGPNGHIYGSSLMPSRLFEATADGRLLKNHGRFSFAEGDAYSIATIENNIYLASYPGSRITVYNPSLPFHYGTGANDNPRDLGRLDDIGIRPNALITTPGGKLWMGSAPDYGLVGGTLAWFQPSTGEKRSFRAIVPETTPASLLWLPDQKQILVGLSIEVGTGARIKRLTGGFALWDVEKDQLAWSGDLGIENLADVVSLINTENGLVYALVGRGDQILTQGAPEIAPRLVLIDPIKRAVVAEKWLPKEYGPLSWHGLHALRRSSNGTIYGATAFCIFRILPGSCNVERVWQGGPPRNRPGTVWLPGLDDNQIDVVGPIIGNELFFATGCRLRAVSLP